MVAYKVKEGVHLVHSSEVVHLVHSSEGVRKAWFPLVAGVQGELKGSHLKPEVAANTEEIGMGVGTAEVVLEAPVAAELAALDTADAWFQSAEQMKHSKHPLVKMGPREPVQQMGLMVAVNAVNGLETVTEVGFEELQVEVVHLEQVG